MTRNNLVYLAMTFLLLCGCATCPKRDAAGAHNCAYWGSASAPVLMTNGRKEGR